MEKSAHMASHLVGLGEGPVNTLRGLGWRNEQIVEDQADEAGWLMGGSH